MSPGPDEARDPWRVRAALASILVLALGLRLWRLDHFSYWLDEILQASWLHSPWPSLWKNLRNDAVHPPLDYIVGWWVEQSAPRDWARKLPAVLWGTGTVAAFGVLVSRRAGRLAGGTAMLLLALAPFHVRYSQELRPYSLGLFTLCLSLLLLDLCLDKPGPGSLAGLFLSCLATMYCLYLAAIVLALASAGLLLNDALTGPAERRRVARRLIRWSPLFVMGLVIAYLPWWPVVVDAASRPALVEVEPLTIQRVGRTLAFFAFASNDGEPLGWPSAIYLAAVGTGAVLALRDWKIRPLALWPMLGYVAIEGLVRVHPHVYATRWFLPAGLPLLALAGVGLARLFETRSRWTGVSICAAAVSVALACHGLHDYYDHGRPDWRKLASRLRQSSPPARVFTENQYGQICLAFYLDGPQWLSEVMRGERQSPEVLNLDGEIVRLTWSWKPGARAWLLLRGDDPRTAALRRWAAQFPRQPYPEAENSTLVELDPARRSAAFAAYGIWSPF